MALWKDMTQKEKLLSVASILSVQVPIELETAPSFGIVTIEAKDSVERDAILAMSLKQMGAKKAVESPNVGLTAKTASKTYLFLHEVYVKNGYSNLLPKYY